MCSSMRNVRNLKQSIDGEQFIGNINQKKKSDVLQAYRCPLYDKCCRQEYFLNKHVECCESVK